MRAVLFHNVVAGPVDVFDRQLERLHENAFRRELDFLQSQYAIVSMDDALARLDAGDAAPGTLVLTFDDGFAGVREVAAPILAERGLVATVFVLTEPGGGMPAGRLFHYEELEIAFRLTTAVSFLHPDGLRLPLGSEAERARALKDLKVWLKAMPEARRRASQRRILEDLDVSREAIDVFSRTSPKYRKLTVDDCRALAGAGWTIGGHTRTHPSLGQVDADTLLEEVGGNAGDLAALGFRNVPFAYPYGSGRHVSDEAAAAVERAAFSCAWTTTPGENVPVSHRFRLNRFNLLALHRPDWARSGPLGDAS